MTKNTRIYKNLKPEHIDFIKFLDENEIDIFNLKQIKEIYNSNVKITEILENLCHKGLIKRIERGKYVRHTFYDEYVIGNQLVPDGVVAYWSALNIHGFTEQIPETVFIQTSREKPEKTVFSTRYKFIQVRKDKITGIETRGYGNSEFRITNREKTIADCFDLPAYGGEYPGIIRAFAGNKFNQQELIEYCKIINNNAAIKRMGYCAEVYKLPMKKFIAFAKSRVNKTINPFDPFGTNHGNIITKWGLRLNIQEENILEFINY